MIVKPEGYLLPVTKSLIDVLQQVINNNPINPEDGIVINFRDPDYDAETGGYHPVEIAMDGAGQIIYITDFSYVGQPPYSELVKEIDFDFSLGLFQQMGRDYPIEQGRELYADDGGDE